MKVAIITLKDSPNYGGILQAYALQEAIKSLGYECDLIDYMTPEFRKKFSFFGKPKNMTLVYWIFKKVQYPLMCIMMKKMMPFYKHMDLTEHFDKKDELKKLNKLYDIFITGSDQVWACDLNYYDDAYFLSFVEPAKKRISYAASLGRTIDMLKNEEKEFIAEGLKHIDKISLREKSGIDVVKVLSGKEACDVIDPTLLLGVDDYKKVMVTPEKKPYILCYLMQSRKNDRTALCEAKKMSKATGLPLVKICRGLTSFLWGETLYVPSVEEWLGLFSNAKYVFTNSFHGVAFSINFNRNFSVFIEGGIDSGRNSRVYNICSKVNLLDRIFVIGKSEKLNTSDIDYSDVNKIIEQLRDEGLEFLKGTFK